MNTSIRGRSVVCNCSGLQRTAFTLIELLVVISTMAVLAVMLLPALAGTQAQSKTTACEARFRQWAASANLYANDNRGWLPSFDAYGGGAFAWDVGTNMVYALYPYGMDVPVWFCPMRPAALDEANAWARTSLGHPIQSIYDLERHWGLGPYSSEIILNDNYWVPRYDSTTKTSSNLFPRDYSTLVSGLWPAWLRNEPTPTSAIYGWPKRLHDAAVPTVPFVSDTAGSGMAGGLTSPVVGSSTSYLSPNTAHFVNSKLIGVNLAFADGHVTSHTPTQMLCVYSSIISGNNFWFY